MCGLGSGLLNYDAATNSLKLCFYSSSENVEW